MSGMSQCRSQAAGLEKRKCCGERSIARYDVVVDFDVRNFFPRGTCPRFESNAARRFDLGIARSGIIDDA